MSKITVETQSSALSPQSFLFALLAAYLVVAGLFAIFTPPWQTPDEPAHYAYIAQVAGVGCCPVIEMGDWDSAYLDELKSQHFRADLLDNLPTVQYEDHQPPLYYLLASLVFKLTSGSLVALRLFTVVIGAGVVASAYAVVSAMFPDRQYVALGAAAFVAFLPQHVATMASVNNDALAEVVIGVTLLLTIRYLQGRTRYIASMPVMLGVLVGVGLLTKLSTLFLAGLVPLAILLKWRAKSRSDDDSVGTRYMVSDIIAFSIPALVLGGIWWLRNIGVYGWPDIFGLRAHNLVVADQLRTADYIASIGWGQYLNNALLTTFHSFWGQFGWMAVPMPDWIYAVIGLLLLLVAAGLLLDVFVLRRKQLFSPLPEGLPDHGSRRASSLRRLSWVIIWATAILAVLAYLYYNTEFVQFQARYMFPGLIPFALFMVLGVDAWRRLLVPRWAWLTLVAFLPLALLDLYLLWRVIVPGLAP